jgi:hypothetical protein
MINFLQTNSNHCQIKLNFDESSKKWISFALPIDAEPHNQIKKKAGKSGLLN